MSTNIELLQGFDCSPPCLCAAIPDRFLVEADRGGRHSRYFFAVKIFALRTSARKALAAGGDGTWPSSTA
jgi:hypothetical protein